MKRVKRLVGFRFFPMLFPSLGQNLIPWYELLKNSVRFFLEDEKLKRFDKIKRDLVKATETTFFNKTMTTVYNSL